MRRALGIGLAVAGLVLAVGVIPASAVTSRSITIDATTLFDSDPDDFVATGIPGCATGTVVDGAKTNVRFPPPHGVYAGYKVFECAGAGDDGFVLRLNARFGNASVGTWAVVSAWGSAAGMHGAGDLVGENVLGGIEDHYTGTVIFR
jgi:hypothetical protein